MAEIKVLLVQMTPVKGEKRQNLDKIKKMIDSSNERDLDLVVLPEFFNTGIGNDVFRDGAEIEDSSETIDFLSKIAIEYNTNLVTGTISEKDGDNIYNTSYFIDRNGKVLGKYRKRHLFNYYGGNEGECFTPGEEIVVLNTDIGKVGMSICFDIRFPLQFNKLMKMGAELIVCPAAWAYDWLHTWEICNQSIALQNLAYFIGCTGCGEAGYQLAGNSMIVGPTGKIISRLDKHESVLVEKIDLSRVQELRSAFPIMNLE